MVRLMPVADIGVWSLFISVTSILELLRNGFIRNPMITHVVSADSEEERRKVIAASWVLHTILVATTCSIMLLAAGPLTRFWQAPQLDVLFYVYVLRAIVLIPCLQFEYFQQIQSNFKAIFIANISRLTPPAVYLMYKFVQVNVLGYGTPPTLLSLSIVQLFAAAGSIFVGYYFIRGTPLFIARPEGGMLRVLSSFGKYTMGTTISSMIIKSTDTWMIGRMISTVGVALYNPALRISNLIEVPTLAVASLVYPKVGQKMKEGGNAAVQEVYIKSVSVILAMMLPGIIPIFIFSDLIIELIFGTDYLAAAPILRVTVFFTLFIPFNRQFGTVMDALKRPQINFYLLVMMGVINIVTNYFLIGKYGPIGAAYGTLLSYIIIFFLNQVILFRLYGIQTLKVFPAIFEWYRMGINMFLKKSVKFL